MGRMNNQKPVDLQAYRLVLPELRKYVGQEK